MSDQPPDNLEADNLREAIAVSGWPGAYLAVGDENKQEWIKSDFGVEMEDWE